MLIVHHLRRSQSERVVWAVEEIGLEYELKCYTRAANGMAPPEYKALHPFGAAPVIQDGAIILAETSAIMEYLFHKLGKGRLTVGPDAKNYTDYLYWLHFANGSFLPAGMMAMAGPMAGMDQAAWDRTKSLRLDRAFEMVEKRLGEAPYFAGPEFTVADIMMVLPLTKSRMMNPRDLSGSPHTLAYLQRIGARPAFQRAMQKADPDLPLYLT